MIIFEDYINGLRELLSQVSIFGYTWGVVLQVLCLILLVIIGAAALWRLIGQLYCTFSQTPPDYSHIPLCDREWFRLASIILLRGECVLGKSARTLVRGLPGITLGEDGAFESLGPMPFEGLMLIASAMRKAAGVYILIPLFRNKETRRIVHLIPRT